MTEKLMARIEKMGVRIVNSDKRFIEENRHDIENMLFHHSITVNVFKIAIRRGLKELKFARKKEQFVNIKDERLKFLYAFHNWFLLGDLTNMRLLLYKIE